MGVDQESDAEKPKEKHTFMGELDNAGFDRLEGVRSNMMQGMRDVENIMLVGDISQKTLTRLSTC